MARKQRKRTRIPPNGNGVSYGSRVLYDDVVALAGTLMRGQKQYGADRINSLANATREYADAMPELPNLRVYVASAAERLEDLSDYVTRTEFEDMVDDAGRLARQYPMATLGLAIAAGLGATRLMHIPSLRNRWKQKPVARTRAKSRRRPGSNGSQARAQA